MKRFLVNILRQFVYFIVTSNSKLPAILESEFQYMQGKGFVGTVEDEAKIALEFISRSGIKIPVVLDIGANVGSYSLAIRKFAPEATIFAFEPSSVARKKLVDRFLGDNLLAIVPLALGKTKSKGILWSDTQGSGLASLSKRKLDHFGIYFDQSESVDVVTLDSWANSNKIRPNLIKIDVEGHELDVLEGGCNTLAQTQVVQFEFGGTCIDTRTFFKDYWYFLTNAGFTLYRISQGGPIRIPHYSEQDECFRFTNYLAVRG